MVSSRRGGKSGRATVGGAGSIVRIAAETTADVAPANARWPVAISYSTSPNENRSDRTSSGSPRSCSGDI